MAQSSVTTASGTPLGLFTLAITTFILGVAFTGLLGAPLAAATAVISLAFFYGGLVELLAGTWEFRAGNTLTGTIFCSYAGFWLALGFILWPPTGIAAALGKSLLVVLGFFLLAWTIFTLLILISVLRTNLALIIFFVLLFVTLALLTLGLLLPGAAVLLTIGGYIGILTAIVAAYTALAIIAGLPVGARA
ncbi:MAG: acetate uptake transporter [Ktedonobacteraceae bacterium]|nr:acetate uptake transporter [Ktedonobacteraceae bacterium]